MWKLFTTVLLCVVACPPLRAESPLPRVPDGFRIERVAATPLVEHPMLGCLDDRGRLYVAESAGLNLKADELLRDPPNFIRRLEDTDGDGVFDRSTIFADKMTFPQGALWYRDSLYVASPPYIWKLRDTNDDGVADERTILVKSFGFTGNAADIHGCFLSPEGRIFWCDGRHGHEFQNEQGELVSKGKAARIFSCLPDGSDVRVYCGGGMDNPVEVDFTETGEVIGTVNILYGQPRIDALVHWIEHGVYPREDQGDCIAEFDYTGELLSPIARLGHVAVSGTARYRSDSFGAEYRDNFFISVFNTHRVVRSILTPSGSTFTSREEDFLVSDNPDFHPTDVLEDVDGSLLVIDTGGWFRIGCPTSQIAKPELHGAIYRISKNGIHHPGKRVVHQQDWKSLNDSTLLVHLDSPRPTDREQAIEELSRRHEYLQSDELKVLAQQIRRGNPMTRRNLLWAIQRSGLSELQGLIEQGLSDPDESVRLVALRCLSYADSVSDLKLLLARLASESRTERRAAASCLESIGLKSGLSVEQRQTVTTALIDVLSDSQLDRHLEHALVHALLKIGDPTTMQAALQGDAPAIKRNLLVVLSQRDDAVLSAQQVLPHLGSADPLLQRESLRIVQQHPEWMQEFSARLSQWLSTNDPQQVPWDSVRSVLLKTFDQPDVRKSIAAALLRESTATPVQLFLFEILEQSVTGETVPDWFEVIPGGLRHSSVDVRRQTLQFLRKDPTGKFDSLAQELFRSETLDAETRLLALQALAPRLSQPDSSMIRFLLDQTIISDDNNNTLRAMRAAETLTALPDWNPETLQELSHSIPALSAIVLPKLSSRMRTVSDPTLREKYLQQVLSERAYDQFSDQDVAAWNEETQPAPVRELIQKISEARAKQSEDRRARLEALAALLSGGNPQKGEQVFLSRTAACSGCHRIGEQGGKIGPDLSQIGRIRTPHDLLEAIVFPSASYARGYESYQVVTEDGRILNGVIPVETASEIVLRTADQREQRIRRNQIEVLVQSTVSVMPQGIDKLITEEELRDLLAYLSQRQ